MTGFGFVVDKQDLYKLGARRIGVTSLPPLGCLPAARTLFGYHERGCVSRINTDAQGFNKKINSAVSNLQKQFPDLKIAVFDIFKPLYDLVQSPSSNGKRHFELWIHKDLLFRLASEKETFLKYFAKHVENID